MIGIEAMTTFVLRENLTAIEIESMGKHCVALSAAQQQIGNDRANKSDDIAQWNGFNSIAHIIRKENPNHIIRNHNRNSKKKERRKKKYM